MEGIMIYIQIFVTVVAVVVSIVSSYITWKKLKPDLESSKANSIKTNAETIEIYSREIRKLKDEQIESEKRFEEERLENNRKFAEMKEEIEGLKTSQSLERVAYRQFINELLIGITKLTGQIQIRGEQPVWTAPAKLPFDLNVE